MVLAAGLGTRLRPLTDQVPKPLLPLGGRPLIEYTLGWLTSAGIRHVMINLHYKGDLIRRTLGDGRRLGVELSYSEEPEILGTGGALKRVESYFADGPFLVVNADILTNFDPRTVIAAHEHTRALATLVVRHDAEAAAYGLLGLAADGRIRRFLGRGPTPDEPLQNVMFTGIHVVDPRVLAQIPPHVFAPITDAYMAMVERQDPLFGVCTDAVWIDIGTPDRYREAERLVAAGVIVAPPRVQSAC